MIAPPFFKPKEIASGVLEFAPAETTEFAVQQLTVSLDFNRHSEKSSLQSEANELPNVNASSILIVVAGNARIAADDAQIADAVTGAIFFIPASTRKTRMSDASADFRAYRAYTPLPQQN